MTPPLHLALELKDKILGEEKLTCSIGIGPNKVVAKIASDFKKPNGLTVVRSDEVLAFLSPLPIDRIYGVGPKTAKLLEENGITTIPDLASAPTERLEDLFGKKLAVYLHNASNGIDEEPVIDRGRDLPIEQDNHAEARHPRPRPDRRRAPSASKGRP